MFTRYRRATTVSAPATSLTDTNRLATSLADTSISVNVTAGLAYNFVDRPVPAVTALTTTVSDCYRPGSPVDPTPDTPTITRILLSTLDGVQCGVPTLTTPTLTPTTLRNIQHSFLQASQLLPSETHSNQAGFVPPIVHPQPGSTFISIDSKSLGGGIATVVDPSCYSTHPGDHFTSTTFSKDGLVLTNTTSTSGSGGTVGGPPPLLPISGILNSHGLPPLPGPTSNHQQHHSTTTSSSTSSSALPLCIVTSVAGGRASCSTSPMPSVSLSAYSSDSDTVHSLSDAGVASSSQRLPRRMGGRRPNNNEKLSSEEEAKRSVRRERNKMAAARCRKRRLDQTMTLQEETDHLEEKKSSLQHEITLLQQQREELEFLLATHKAVCTRSSRGGAGVTKIITLPSSSSSSNSSTVIVTTSSRDTSSSGLPSSFTSLASDHRHYAEPHMEDEVHVKQENLSDCEDQYSNSLFGTIIPNNNNNDIHTVSSAAPVLLHSSSLSLASSSSSAFVPSTSSAFRDRFSGSSGSKPNRPTSLAVAPLTELGVSIETPSAGLRGLNFESMMDGGTGLTPVTPLTGGMLGSMSTGLTPLTTPIMPHPSASVASTSNNNNNNNNGQCGYQQRSSSSELSSPDSMSSKQLVSL